MHPSGGPNQTHGDGDVAEDNGDERKEGYEGEGDPRTDVLLEDVSWSAAHFLQRAVRLVLPASGPKDVEVLEDHDDDDDCDDVHGSTGKAYLAGVRRWQRGGMVGK